MRPLAPYIVATAAGAAVGLAVMKATRRTDLSAAAILGVAGAVSIYQLRRGV